MNKKDIVIESGLFRLTVDPQCKAKSLIIKTSGEECLCQSERLPLFSVTQERPYNNEIKLSHPIKRIICCANSICREGDRLIVGFELAPYKAVIRIKETGCYAAFMLESFILDTKAYGGLKMTPPPVSEFRIIQLPVKRKKRFGEWLNVVSDDQSAICVLGTDRYARIDSGKCRSGYVLTADAVDGIQLVNTGAALIACKTEQFMDAVDQIEKDFDLPRGAQSRRNPLINASIMWVNQINAENVEDYIRYAQLGGFKLMLIYYTAFFKEEGAYNLNGDYRFNDRYPLGKQNVQYVVDRLKEAGIRPGLHFLHTHIGLKSRYISPQTDYRINIKKSFTLAKPINDNDEQLTVHENPSGATTCDGCRVLKLDGELMTYEKYSVTEPYTFFGLQRGAYGTQSCAHRQGCKGGILDISEYGAGSAYIDQNTDLQDEIAGKIAEIYNLGFEFAYFDGSEGTNAPYDYHIPNAQYRVYRLFKKAPLFCEGAAKAHFSWHMLSGGNAFDIFPPEVFKQKICQFPLEEAPRMRNDYTRLNFGWWNGRDMGLQPDMIEYGTSKAAAWDCPATIQFNIDTTPNHPRFSDIMETFRRWEEARSRGLLSQEDKNRLKNEKQEYTLMKDGKGGYELVRIQSLDPVEKEMSAYLLKWRGKTMIMYWHKTAEGIIRISLPASGLHLYNELSGSEESIEESEGCSIIPVGQKRYIYTDSSTKTLINAFLSAHISEN